MLKLVDFLILDEACNKGENMQLKIGQMFRRVDGLVDTIVKSVAVGDTFFYFSAAGITYDEKGRGVDERISVDLEDDSPLNIANLMSGGESKMNNEKPDNDLPNQRL